jgi:tRNA threonylcarbamoyladenosine biosynthesis protein TsaB
MSACLLAVETATDACSVALSLDGHVFEEFVVMPRQHTQKILLMLDALLAQAGVHFSQIDALAFGRGPGSFTGLRIAASVIQGLAVAWDRPVVPISTLHALAQGAHRKLPATHIFSCLDARMHEIYGGFYEFSVVDQQMMPFSPEFLTCPTQVAFPDAVQWFGAGNGCEVYLPAFKEHQAFVWDAQMELVYPSAYDVVTLAKTYFQRGEAVTAEDALPVYFRERVV